MARVVDAETVLAMMRSEEAVDVAAEVADARFGILLEKELKLALWKELFAVVLEWRRWIGGYKQMGTLIEVVAL